MESRAGTNNIDPYRAPPLVKHTSGEMSKTLRFVVPLGDARRRRCEPWSAREVSKTLRFVFRPPRPPVPSAVQLRPVWLRVDCCLFHSCALLVIFGVGPSDGASGGQSGGEERIDDRETASPDSLGLLVLNG